MIAALENLEQILTDHAESGSETSVKACEKAEREMMVRIHSTQSELIPPTTLEDVGLRLWQANDPEHYGYPGGLDLFDCLWFELVNMVRLGTNWRHDRHVA